MTFAKSSGMPAVLDGNLRLKGVELMREITRYELQYSKIFEMGGKKITKKEKRAIRDELQSRCRRIGISDAVPHQLFVLIGPDIVNALMFSLESADLCIISHRFTVIMEILDEIYAFINSPYKYQVQKLKERILIFRNGWKKRMEKVSPGIGERGSFEFVFEVFFPFHKL
jgi:hypothetical protein